MLERIVDDNNGFAKDETFTCRMQLSASSVRLEDRKARYIELEQTSIYTSNHHCEQELLEVKCLGGHTAYSSRAQSSPVTPYRDTPGY